MFSTRPGLEWPSDWSHGFSSEGASDDGSMVLLHGKGGVANLDNQPTWIANDQQRAYHWHYHLRKKGGRFFFWSRGDVCLCLFSGFWLTKFLNKTFEKVYLWGSVSSRRNALKGHWPYPKTLSDGWWRCRNSGAGWFIECKSASRNLKIWMFELFEPPFFWYV